jgi:hypothetical protein
MTTGHGSGSPGAIRLVLELTLSDGELTGGSVSTQGSRPVGFDGWIGLLGAISEFCAQAHRPPARADDGDPPDIP